MPLPSVLPCLHDVPCPPRVDDDGPAVTIHLAEKAGHAVVGVGHVDEFANPAKDVHGTGVVAFGTVVAFVVVNALDGHAGSPLCFFKILG